MLFGVVALVVAAILGLSAVLFKALDKSESFTLWAVPVALVLTVVGVVSGAMAKVSDWREKRAHAAREWQAQVMSLLRLPIRSGRVPRLAELGDVELGVTPTRYTASSEDEYVPRRTADDPLRKVLACAESPFPFVVLHGDSKAGKSRTMIEAARYVWPHAPTIVPVDGQALAELMRLEPPLSLETSPAMVWLDDVSVSDLDALSATVLDEWSKRALIVATMTTTAYQNAMRTGSEVGATGRGALRRAVARELPFDLSKNERAEGQRLYPHEQLSADDGDRPVSIGEVLVAGEELVGRLHAGRRDCPAGLAIARAAVDARRAGVLRPIDEAELKLLFPPYLRQVNTGIAPTTKQFAAGLTWAATPVASQVAILRPVAKSQWEILDYIIEAESGEHNHTARPIPGFLWRELLTATTPADALTIGYTSYLADHIDIAIDSMRKAQQHPPTAARGAFLLGLLLRESADWTGARVAYQRALDSGDPDVGPRAAVNLGVMLTELGNLAAAQVAYQQALESGDPEAGARAILGMSLLSRIGHTSRETLVLALDRYLQNLNPTAALNPATVMLHQTRNRNSITFSANKMF
jgi:tetratricopeptide (TPR) repeat protein